MAKERVNSGGQLAAVLFKLPNSILEVELPTKTIMYVTDVRKVRTGDDMSHVAVLFLTEDEYSALTAHAVARLLSASASLPVEAEREDQQRMVVHLPTNVGNVTVMEVTE